VVPNGAVHEKVPGDVNACWPGTSTITAELLGFVPVLANLFLNLATELLTDFIPMIKDHQYLLKEIV